MTRTVDFNQEKILDKAMLVFWQKGYEKTSLQDLLQATGISRSSLYNTFNDKAHLFTACVAHYRKKTAFRKEILLNACNVKEGLREYFKQRIAASYSSPLGCLITNTAVEDILLSESLKPEVDALVQDQFTELEKIFFDLLEKGKQSGEIAASVDIKAQAFLFLNLNHSINVMAKAKMDRSDVEHMVENVIYNL